jgi:flavin-binding protein dodecin
MDHVYATSDVYGSSEDSIEDTVKRAVDTAAGHVRNLAWFEVKEIRGHINEDGSIGHYQVGVRLGFRYERKDG